MSPSKAMPLFFFHATDGASDLDHDGTELPDLRAARNHAAEVMGERLRLEPDLAWEEEPLSVVVTDETGVVLLALHLNAATAPGL